MAGSCLRVVFETEGIKQAAEKADKITALEQALKKVVGADLKVQPSVASRADVAPPPKEPPGVTEAKTLFGSDKVFIKGESEE